MFVRNGNVNERNGLKAKYGGLACADPDNIEPGDANSIKYQTKPGSAILFLCITYKGEQGARARCAFL